MRQSWPRVKHSNHCWKLRKSRSRGQNRLTSCFFALFFSHLWSPSKAVSTYLLYSGRTEAWSLTSRSFTWVTMANFQLSSTWVRFEHVLPLLYSTGDRHEKEQCVTIKSEYKCRCNDEICWRSIIQIDLLTFGVPTRHFLLPFLCATCHRYTEQSQNLFQPHFLL